MKMFQHQQETPKKATVAAGGILAVRSDLFFQRRYCRWLPGKVLFELLVDALQGCLNGFSEDLTLESSRNSEHEPCSRSLKRGTLSAAHTP